MTSLELDGIRDTEFLIVETCNEGHNYGKKKILCIYCEHEEEQEIEIFQDP